MELLRRLASVQEHEGAVDDAALRRLAREQGIPLYRLEGLRGFYPVLRSERGAPIRVQVCRDVVCRMAAGGEHAERLRAALVDRGDVEVEEVSCLGRCDAAPAAVVNETPVSGPATELAGYAIGTRPLPEAAAPERPDWPIDPYDHGDARYGVLRDLVAGDIGDPVAAIDAAGLRGLGGAAFPTALKWRLTRDAAGGPKTVICNADESEPGTFKDRMLLECFPHLIIEGMAVAGHTIGARHGIIYLRHEYGRALQVLEAAIADAYQRGALGESVFGSGFDFDLEVFVSPGGYILGEETALLEALEDRRGEPRNKPPFPTNVGLNGRPTLLNNVETLAAVPVILARGADWWAAQGRGDHKGLKVVCVSGDVARPGVHCVPWGTTVAEVLERCGGVADSKRLKAFSPGGASTPFLPADALDTPLDFDAMREAGSGLGTGALVFVAEGRDLVEVALAQVRFFRNESCGKCVPCRVGSRKAVEIAEAALADGAAVGPALQRLNATLERTSICGLGQVALLPLVDLFKHFPDEPGVRQLRGEMP